MRQNIKTTNTALKSLHSKIVTQIDYSKQINYVQVNSREGVKMKHITIRQAEVLCLTKWLKGKKKKKLNLEQNCNIQLFMIKA